MIDSVSFVVPTIGTREHLHETIASIHREGAFLREYEIVVIGNPSKIDQRDFKMGENCIGIRVVSITPPAGLTYGGSTPYFVEGIGFTRCSLPWTAVVADDDCLSPGWGLKCMAIEEKDLQVIYGAVRKVSGRMMDRFPIEHKSTIALVRREVWERHPLNTFYGGDSQWCKEIRKGKVKWWFDESLVWDQCKKEGHYSSFVLPTTYEPDERQFIPVDVHADPLSTGRESTYVVAGLSDLKVRFRTQFEKKRKLREYQRLLEVTRIAQERA